MDTSSPARRLPPVAGPVAGLALLLAGGIGVAPRAEAEGRPEDVTALWRRTVAGLAQKQPSSA